MRLGSAAVGRVALLGFGWVALFYLAFPLVVIIAVSVTNTGYLKFPPSGFTLKWYAAFLDDSSFVGSIWTSAFLALGATAGALVLGIPAALVVARKRFFGREAINALFVSPLVLPAIVIGVAILQYASMLGFARTFWALLVGHIVIVIPYIMRTTLASLSGFEESLEEAAQDLGATPLATFFLITLPQIKPGIIAGSLFAFIVSWINVEVSIFNSTPLLITIPVKIFNYIQFNVDPMVAAVSAATIYVAVAFVIAIDLVVGIDKAYTQSG